MVVISNEKPAMSAAVVPVLVSVTSKLLDDDPGVAVPPAMPRTREALAGGAETRPRPRPATCAMRKRT